jgi:hypothetical protein
VSEAPPIIGFCGRAGAGKSFAAAYLVRAHGFTRLRFAGPIKAMMIALGCTEDEVDGPHKERPSALLGGKTPRQAMQLLGTEWGRQLVADDLWIDAWARHADEALAAGRPIVVDDVRFLNEVTAIRRRGGRIVRVVREGARSSSGATHASETQALPVDAAIYNPGEPEAFERRLYRMVEDVIRLGPRPRG